jgi:hypothetical protein
MDELSKARSSLVLTVPAHKFAPKSSTKTETQRIQVPSKHNKTLFSSFLIFFIPIFSILAGLSSLFGVAPRLPEDPSKPGKEFTANGNLRFYATRGKTFGTYTTGPNQVFWMSYNTKIIKEQPHWVEDESMETRRKVLKELSEGIADFPRTICDTATRIGYLRFVYKYPHKGSWSKGRVVLIGDAAHTFMP